MSATHFFEELTARKDTRLAREPFVAGAGLCAFAVGPDNLYTEIMEDMKKDNGMCDSGKC